MLWPDVIDLKLFYTSPMGHMAQGVIARALQRRWPTAPNDVVLGIGYAQPYLSSYLQDANRVMVLMPAAQGALHWPQDGKNLTFLADESEIPLPDDSVNRVVIVHAFENTEQLRHMLREVWRILVPSGRLLVVAPNRNGVWARMAGSPFAHGSPYSSSQMKAMLRNHSFTPHDMEYALFTPPTTNRFILGGWRAFEFVGRRFFTMFGGVLVSEAEKQIYAASQPKRIKQKAAQPFEGEARPALVYHGCDKG